MSGFMWKYLDHLPKVPDELVKEYTASKLDEGGKPVVIWNNLLRGDPKVPNSIYHRFQVNPELKEWLQQNIFPTATDYGITYNYSPNTYPIQHNPHIDYSREYTIMYNLDNGGDDVRTGFYIDKDKPLEQPQATRIRDYSTLQFLTDVRFDLNRWVILNAKIIHGVKNITSPRINIQLGLKTGDQYTF